MRLDRSMCGGALAVVVVLLASCTAGDVTESTTDETAPPVVAEVAFDHAALMGNFVREFNADNPEATEGGVDEENVVDAEFEEIKEDDEQKSA